MSETRHYKLTCDAPGCSAWVMGKPHEGPAAIRKRVARDPHEAFRWAARKRPQSRFQREHGIYPTDWQDYCPQHTMLAVSEEVTR